MKVSREKKLRKSSIVLNLFFVLSLVFLIGFFLGKSEFISRAGEDTNKAAPVYISVKIEHGDTMEGLAKKYNNTSYSNKKFIERLKTINNLTSDILYTGSYIILEQAQNF